jgi:hypothetical protein
VGKHSAFEGLCRKVYVIGRDPEPVSEYQARYNLDWDECRNPDGRWPNTKVTRCLLEVFRLSPIPDLCRYEIQISDQARQRAREYLESICGPAEANATDTAECRDNTNPQSSSKFRAVLIHYEGNTSGDRKNLSTELIRQACDQILQLDYVPVILDWDRRSPLPDNQRIFCPDANHALWNSVGTGDAEQLAALIDESQLMIGIDSGPLHVAGATTTKTLGVWTRHHPLNFFDISPNVEHLVPADGETQIATEDARKYFRRTYRHREYYDLSSELTPLIEACLKGIEPEKFAGQRLLNKLTATAYSEAYYREHKHAGLDYLTYGEWQRQYGRWFVESLSLKQKRLLDLGCACGSLLKSTMARRNCQRASSYFSCWR